MAADPVAPTDAAAPPLASPPRTLLIATANPGKVREFRDMLGGDRFTWRDLADFPPGPERRGDRATRSAPTPA